MTQHIPRLVQDPAERHRNQFQVWIDSLALGRRQGSQKIILRVMVRSGHEVLQRYLQPVTLSLSGLQARFSMRKSSNLPW